MREVEIQKTPPISSIGHSSKGNQLKWIADGGWYKADHMGYESLAEIVVSRLLQQAEIGYPRVCYEPATIRYDGHTLRGCYSADFLSEGWEIVTLEKLFRQYTGMGLSESICYFSETEDKIKATVDQVIEITGLQDFGAYLTVMLELDAVFLNEDRHANNMAVLYDPAEERFAYCPLFDFGLSLFSDTGWDYPLAASLTECYGRIDPKPFARTFDEQMEAAENLYGSRLRLHWDDVKLRAVLEELSPLYQAEETDRVLQVLREQRRRYAAFFH